MPTFGLTVLRSDKTELPSNEINDFTIHSAARSYKVYDEGYGSFDINGDDGGAAETGSCYWSLDVEHNLGYYPASFFYVSSDYDPVWRSGGTAGCYAIRYYTDEDTVTLYVYPIGGDILTNCCVNTVDTTVYYKYQILVDPALTE